MSNQARKTDNGTEHRLGSGVMSKNIRDDFSYFVYKNETHKAIREASISVACLLDDNFESTKELDKDLEHIQDQITIIENYFEEVSDDNT